MAPASLAGLDSSMFANVGDQSVVPSPSKGSFLPNIDDCAAALSSALVYAFAESVILRVLFGVSRAFANRTAACRNCTVGRLRLSCRIVIGMRRERNCID